jgi:hypothetical protein
MSQGTEEENRLQVDKLRECVECGVEKYIDLPQIVVVGNQSSGKSSVPNALTDPTVPQVSSRPPQQQTSYATNGKYERERRIKPWA